MLAPALASTAPSIAETSTGGNIAVQGSNNSLKLYWATNGTANWHTEKVAPLAV